jgi:hypothetical protein
MKYHLSDPPRERIQSIEKSPQDYYPKQIEIEKEKHAKNTSETVKRKSKKNPSKSNSPAMA